MRALRLLVAAAAAVGIMLALSSPANAWGNGTYLRTGDVFCTDQARSDTGARFTGHVVNGSGTASIRAAATAGGPETVVWSQTGTNLNFNKYHYGPTAYYRGCVTITAHTVNTWGKSFILGLGASAVSDIGPNTALLSPGGRTCGDSGMGPVRLTGTAPTGVTWYLNGTDQDYAFVGTVFSTGGSSVDTVFVPGPELTGLEMCVHNSSQQTVSVSYELSQA